MKSPLGRLVRLSMCSMRFSQLCASLIPRSPIRWPRTFKSIPFFFMNNPHDNTGNYEIQWAANELVNALSTTPVPMFPMNNSSQRFALWFKGN